MEVFKNWNVFGLHIYISSRRMCRKTKNANLLADNRGKLRKIKSRLYKMCGGVCQECGRKFDKDDLEIHHIIPTSENPRLVVSVSNIQLVCPECHAKLHGHGYHRAVHGG